MVFVHIHIFPLFRGNGGVCIWYNLNVTHARIFSVINHVLAGWATFCFFLVFCFLFFLPKKSLSYSTILIVKRIMLCQCQRIQRKWSNRNAGAPLRARVCARSFVHLSSKRAKLCLYVICKIWKCNRFSFAKKPEKIKEKRTKKEKSQEFFDMYTVQYTLRFGSFRI